MKKIIVAIDGFSGTGKSSTAKAVAQKLGYIYIDSGAMYRAVTYYFMKNGVDFTDPESVKHHLKRIDLQFRNNGEKDFLMLNDEWVDGELRTMEVNANVSAVSVIVAVRHAMVKQQQALGTEKGIVMDGRDIGTVVFPNAELKVFMTASLQVRGDRRLMELKQKGIHSELGDVTHNLKERDRIDSTRDEGPLAMAEGAMEIDTSDLTFDEQVKKIVEAAERIIHES